jgi:hypothetical protein
MRSLLYSYTGSFLRPGRRRRWTQQLKDTATVDRFSFEGLQQADGQPVKDLNDLLKISGKSQRKNSDAIKNIMGTSAGATYFS